jgi:hypothetical protein
MHPQALALHLDPSVVERSDGLIGLARARPRGSIYAQRGKSYFRDEL